MSEYLTPPDGNQPPPPQFTEENPPPWAPPDSRPFGSYHPAPAPGSGPYPPQGGPYAAPPPTPPASPDDRLMGRVKQNGSVLVTIAFMVVVLIAGLASTGFVLGFQAHQHDTHQATEISQLQKKATALQKQMNANAATEAADHGKDLKEMTGLQGALLPLVQLATTTCSGLDNGPKGPATYYYGCSPTKPSSSTG